MIIIKKIGNFFRNMFLIIALIITICLIILNLGTLFMFFDVTKFKKHNDPENYTIIDYTNLKKNKLKEKRK